MTRWRDVSTADKLRWWRAMAVLGFVYVALDKLGDLLQ